MELILLFISAAVVNNFVLSYFLGICPFVGVSKKLSSAVSMGMAVSFVMAITAIVTWLIYHLILVPFHLEILECYWLWQDIMLFLVVIIGYQQ